jgi:acetyl-CoA carboxylase biotin carboxyl carrier protein
MIMEVLSPFSGKLIKILIEKGAKVNEDDEAFVIEAMKMETPIYAPCSGTVKEIKVKENQDVEADGVLAIIE